MPIYEFQCIECSERFQLLVGMTAESEAGRCPKCGSARLQKLVSRFSQGRDEDARLSEIADQIDVSGEPESYSGARRLAREMGAALDDKASDDMEFMLDEGIGGD
ncbi:MAG: zinc ribbon domain-containing protein [Armatimonadetes bacterium]|nr:zinc ribbon domain-containing protein [Armatimonadota bacterium]